MRPYLPSEVAACKDGPLHPASGPFFYPRAPRITRPDLFRSNCANGHTALIRSRTVVHEGFVSERNTPGKSALSAMDLLGNRALTQVELAEAELAVLRQEHVL